MNELFKAIYNGQQAHSQTQDLVGKVYGVQLAIVADTSDPLNLGRLRAMLAPKGGNSLTDWLTRVMPWYGLSAPYLNLGDTILVAFVDGDPHKGYYLGVLQNIVNPAYDPDKLLYTFGGSQLAIDSQGSLTFVTGGCKLNITKTGSVSFTGVKNFTINGKQVATLGAKDTDQDTLVSKGW